MRRSWLTCLALALAAAPAAAQRRPARPPTGRPSRTARSRPILIKAARIETGSRGAIWNGAVLVQGDKILAAGADLKAPRGTQVIDLGDGVLMPALVGVTSRLGIERGASGNHVKVAVDWNPLLGAFHRIRQAGVGAIGLWPASSGQLGVGILVPESTDPKLTILADGVGLRTSFRAGTSSKSGLKRLLEGALKAEAAAKKYAAQRKMEILKARKEGAPPPEDDPEKDPARNEKSAPLVALAAGKIPLWISVSGAASIPHLRQAVEPFTGRGSRFRFILSGDTDLYLARDELVKLKLPLVLPTGFSSVPRSRVVVNTAAELSRAGVGLVFMPPSDSTTGYEQWRDRLAQLIRAGLPRDVAIRGITAEPARLLGVAGKVGSIDKGALANLVALSGDPFDPASRITTVWIRGKVVHRGG